MNPVAVQRGARSSATTIAGAGGRGGAWATGAGGGGGSGAGLARGGSTTATGAAALLSSEKLPHTLGTMNV